MKALGKLEPDPVGQILRTQMMRFQSPLQIDGLCRVKGKSVELLAVLSPDDGKGHFRNFIQALKTEADSIRVMHINNPQLKAALHRYGFSDYEDVESIQGEIEFVTGMEWKR